MPPTSKKKKKNSGKKSSSNKNTKRRQSQRTRMKRKSRQGYGNEALTQAIAAVQKGESIRRVSHLFKIPTTTLFRYSKNPTLKPKRSGPRTVLNDADENRISEWALHRSKIGKPVTKEELLLCVKDYLIAQGITNPFPTGCPGRKWWQGFMRRHPNLAIRKAQNITTVRLQANQQRLSEWCQGCQEYLLAKDLLHIPPKRKFNCDETSMILNPKLDKVIAEKGAPTVYQAVEGDEKENITVLFMYNAEGERAPPMIVYKGKSVPLSVLENIPEDCNHWGVGATDNGWMDIKTFYEYFTNVFYKWLVKEEYEFPILVFMDGHSSHFPLPLIEFCREKNIELIPLYPNSTQVSQPLDFSFFSPLKKYWKQVAVPMWKKVTGNTQVSKENFAQALHYALETLPGEKTSVVSGFRATGLEPWDPQKLAYNILNKQKKKKTNQEATDTQPLVPVPSLQKNDALVDILEKNVDSSALQQMMAQISEGSWNASLDKETEFNYFIRIEKISDESMRDRPRIVSDQVLLNKYPLRVSDSGMITVDLHKDPVVANNDTSSNVQVLSYINNANHDYNNLLQSKSRNHSALECKEAQSIDRQVSCAEQETIQSTEHEIDIDNLDIELQGEDRASEAMVINYDDVAIGDSIHGSPDVPSLNNQIMNPTPVIEIIPGETLPDSSLISNLILEQSSNISSINSITDPLRQNQDREINPCREINVNVSSGDSMNNPLHDSNENCVLSLLPSGNKENGEQANHLNLFNNRQQPKKKRKSRTAFTNQQIFELEKRFLYQKYLSPADRDEIAAQLGLSNAQVITWFQNRRAKLKRDMEELKKDVQSVNPLLVAQHHKTFLENVQDLGILKKRPLPNSIDDKS